MITCNNAEGKKSRVLKHSLNRVQKWILELLDLIECMCREQVLYKPYTSM